MSSKILLDTTYILPALGVEVDVEEKTFEKLRELSRSGRIECFYTPFNVLEALWKVAKTPYDPKVLLSGLESIKRWFGLVVPDAEEYVKALELRKKGFGDLIDLILYSVARKRGLKFLTRDKRLVEFLKSAGEDMSVIVGEDF